jgi:hypothetical protein
VLAGAGHPDPDPTAGIGQQLHRGRGRRCRRKSADKTARGDDRFSDLQALPGALADHQLLPPTLGGPGDHRSRAGRPRLLLQRQQPAQTLVVSLQLAEATLLIQPLGRTQPLGLG